ncbi:hypothetical protein AEQ67_18530 [Pseudomonas sp. RIT-PI-q]|uniref:hypothetical protein n=1 Tax=Pseudomonas sp. RIT-PI-q TaxID=1690247 RepID=UPI0006CCE029|nr:hypothetical protein [Pseudomonas sp. RIT-PI-q]KPG95943.1 hypothetical protein AEQ67_18530 [Pseudomonas sp. RIT-PI-q]
MHNELLETQVWRLVQQSSDAKTFEGLVQLAVDSFIRSPGLDPLVRLHESDIGLSGIQVLRDALCRRDFHIKLTADVSGLVALRRRLKDHIRFELQRYLIEHGKANDEMQADQLDRDLGL